MGAKGDAAFVHALLQNFHQTIEIGLVDVHFFVRQFHIRPFVLARTSRDLAKLVAQAFLELRRVGFFKEWLHAFVSHEVFVKFIHQSGHTGFSAKGLIEAVIGLSGQGQKAAGGDQSE